MLMLGHKPGMHAGHVTEERYMQLYRALGPARSAWRVLAYAVYAKWTRGEGLYALRPALVWASEFAADAASISAASVIMRPGGRGSVWDRPLSTQPPRIAAEMVRALIVDRPWWFPPCRPDPLPFEYASVRVETDAATGVEGIDDCGPRGVAIIRTPGVTIYMSAPLPPQLHINSLELFTHVAAMLVVRDRLRRSPMVWHADLDNTCALAWAKARWHKQEAINEWLGVADGRLDGVTVERRWRPSRFMLADIGTRCAVHQADKRSQSCSEFRMAIAPTCRLHSKGPVWCPRVVAGIHRFPGGWPGGRAMVWSSKHCITTPLELAAVWRGQLALLATLPCNRGSP